MFQWDYVLALESEITSMYIFVFRNTHYKSWFVDYTKVTKIGEKHLIYSNESYSWFWVYTVNVFFHISILFYSIPFYIISKVIYYIFNYVIEAVVFQNFGHTCHQMALRLFGLPKEIQPSLKWSCTF